MRSCTPSRPVATIKEASPGSTAMSAGRSIWSHSLAPGGVFNLTVRYDKATGCTDHLNENDLVTNSVQVTANELDPNLANNNSSASFVFSSGEQIGVIGWPTAVVNRALYFFASPPIQR